MMSSSFHLADDGLFVPALDIVPLDAVAVEVVQDPDAPLVLAALLCLPDQIKRLNVFARFENSNGKAFCLLSG